MIVGFIGAGRVATAYAELAVRAGHQVILSNSRGPASLSAVVDRLGDLARAGTVDEAVQADVVVLAVGWDQVDDAIRPVADWTGKTVVDTTNQWHGHDPNRPADLGDLTGSEFIAAKLPGADVVKAFNTLYASVVTTSPAGPDGRLTVFLAGDSAPAKAKVVELVQSFGFEPIDLGSLRTGGALLQAGGPLVSKHFVRTV